MLRTAVAVSCSCLLAVAATAQVPSPGQAPEEIGFERLLHGTGDRAAGSAAWTVWVAAAGRAGERALRDEAPYLEELQRRYADKFVRFVVVLRGDAAVHEAARSPAFAVASAPLTGFEDVPYRVFLADVDGAVQARWRSPDGLADWIDAALAGTLDGNLVAELVDLIPSLLPQVIDGGDNAEAVAHCATKAPRCGEAQALTVLHAWWSTGDYDAARRAFDRAMTSLAGESLPLVVFADLVLRGDHVDPLPPKRLAMALAPASALAADGPFTQLTYLRALLRVGQHRQAGRITALLPKLCAGDAWLQLVLAETLAKGDTPDAHRDLVERALADAAAAEDVDPRWLAGARHELLARTDPDGAKDLLEAYVKGDAVRTRGLNDDSWYLMVEPETMGRFPALALALARRMQQEEGEDLQPNSMDTAALAWFVAGHPAEAAELQDKAVGKGGQPTWVARQRRFHGALALLERVSKTDAPK